ncbi:MAG: hypothetical protein QOI64_60 [Solirubrobacteraceae bacterium]|jgi:hypothetical protein|nr:hypothetical protein [Solirubrobacteraceae bacterium]
MKPTLAILIIAAGLSAYAVAASGADAGQTLTLIGRQITESGPKGTPGPRSTIVFSGRETGDDSGRSYVQCTLIDRVHGLCLGHFRLKNGTISVETVLPLEDAPKRLTLDITGGTGAYNGARGTATFTDIGKDRTREVFALEP